MALNPVQMSCGKCGKPVAVQLAAQPQIFNLMYTSLIVVEHSGQEMCPHCGTIVNPAVAGLQGFMMSAVPVPEEQQNKVIVPGSKIPRA